MSDRLTLPLEEGLRTVHVPAPASWSPLRAPADTREAYAAAHVVVDPRNAGDPRLDPAVDWDATMAYRHHLWGLGLGVAEAMDTAQRGRELSRPLAEELIRRTLREAAAVGGDVVAGVTTDDLDPAAAPSLEEIVASYERQCAEIEELGGRPVLMASRHLLRVADGPEDFRRVYDAVLAARPRPVLLHWLGEAFDPSLAGYWGHHDLDDAVETFLDLLDANAERVHGVKLSLLDRDREVTLRRRVPSGVRMFTGDDFHYPELIAGDEDGLHSHALLGVFDAIAPAASTALRHLDEGNVPAARSLLEATEPLARRLFEHPTFHYKAGVVLLAYLNGHQSHFRMLGGFEGARSVVHLSHVFLEAAHLGLLHDPEAAIARMRPVLRLAGVDPDRGAPTLDLEGTRHVG